MNKRKYRHEKKYYIDSPTATILKQRLSHIMRPDSHSEGEYIVSSLYFDDIYNTAFYDKQNGILERDKTRVRYYNQDKGFLRLEYKYKYGEMISKESIPISVEQYDMMCDGNYSFMHGQSNPLLDMIYSRHTTRRLRPIVLVEYTRQVFVYPHGNVRVTFDTNLESTIMGSALPLLVLHDRNSIILELKYDHFLPELIIGLFSGLPLRETTISKYTICVQKKGEFLYG